MGMSKLAGIAAAVALAIMPGVTFLASDVGAQTCEYPIFVVQNSTTGNVMLILDSSGSMNEIVRHDSYNAMTTYTGNFTSTNTYTVSSDGSREPNDFNSGWPSSPSAYLVNSDGGKSGEYPGNYLNWVYFHVTVAERAAIPTTTRIQVAKAVASDLIINTTADVRFGIMKFNADDGGTVIAGLGSTQASLLSAISGITADGWTPLAETLMDAKDYLFASGGGAPISQFCQNTFIVLVTDGLPTQDLNISGIGDVDGDGREPGTCASIGAPYPNSWNCSHWVDDVAGYIYQNDLRPDLDGQQNAIVYSVGFGIDAPLLAEVANDGGGLYFTANNAAELQTALGNVFDDILGQISAGSAVAVVSQENASNNRLYRAKFVPGLWSGLVEAFNLPWSPGDAAVWEAGAVLKARNPDTRTIWTTTNNVDLFPFTFANRATLRTPLTASSNTQAGNIIEWVRGKNVSGFRDRAGWKLGDIVNSAPVMVGPPSYFYDFLNYAAFRTANKNRAHALYVGSNDGMLHAFNPTNGNEMWAYTPKNTLGLLKGLTSTSYCHDFFVNSTPKPVDVYIGGAWKTVLMCGEREGGGAYFAIDVTNPATPDLLWEVVNTKIKGASWAEPEVGRVQSLDKFVSFVGSGPDRTAGQAYVVAMDPLNGAELWSNLLSTASPVDTNMATSALLVDLNYDDYQDLLYVGDFLGTMYRFDLRTSPWTKTTLFQGSQPIMAQPVASIDTQGRVLVFFGTGRYLDVQDNDYPSGQAFYCVIDNHSGSTVTTSSMKNQTSTFTALTATDRGWYVNLTQSAGERIVKPNLLIGGTVYVTSFKPLADVCAAGGESWLYAFDWQDGSNPDDEDGNEDDGTDQRIDDLGNGIASEPVFDFGNEDIVIQFNDTSIHTEDVMGQFTRMIVRSWRQRYQ
jgi:type IV pilus assembly protein PilY1